MTRKNKEKEMFGLMIGFIYIVFGFLQAVVSMGMVTILFIPAKPVGVLVLFVIGAVFLTGYRELNKGIREGVAYIHVGIMLSLLFSFIYILILFAGALETYILKNEDFENWTILDGMRPELYLGLLSLLALFKWRKDFSLSELIPERRKEND